MNRLAWSRSRETCLFWERKQCVFILCWLFSTESNVWHSLRLFAAVQKCTWRRLFLCNEANLGYSILCEICGQPVIPVVILVCLIGEEAHCYLSYWKLDDLAVWLEWLLCPSSPCGYLFWLATEKRRERKREERKIQRDEKREKPAPGCILLPLKLQYREERRERSCLRRRENVQYEEACVWLLSCVSLEKADSLIYSVQCEAREVTYSQRNSVLEKKPQKAQAEESSEEKKQKWPSRLKARLCQKALAQRETCWLWLFQ